MNELIDGHVDGLGGPMPRTRRHVTTTPYPNDRRMQDRARKRPCRSHFLAMKTEFDHLGSKPDGSGSTTLEIRKIPVESNTISNLNEHFSKFGTVTNVQVLFHSYDIQSREYLPSLDRLRWFSRFCSRCLFHLSRS